MESQDLHTHERQILRYLERRILHDDVVPSFDEIRQAVNLPSKDHVFRDLNLLERKGFISRTRGKSRSIRLLRGADGRPFHRGGVPIPLCGVIAAGQPIPAPGSGLVDGLTEVLILTRDIVGDGKGVYALRVKGDSMIDALINDGDVVVLRHQETAENGDMVAVWLERDEVTTLKRFYHEGNRIRLQPENRRIKPIFVDPQDVRVQGRVIAVIRQMA